MAEDDLAVLGAVEADIDVTGVKLVVRVFCGNLPLGLGDTRPGVVQRNFTGPTQTGGTNQLTINIFIMSRSARFNSRLTVNNPQ
ncbi:hypothetical protein D3C84_1050130 [compost metagenome]